jgi:uncharacterized protein (DUF924 family)
MGLTRARMKEIFLSMRNYRSVLEYWFKTLSKAQWFKKDPLVDQYIKEHFGDLLTQARRGELFHWRKNAQGRLAEIILLDQFSRNIYRDSGEAFAGDAVALILAQEMVELKLDQEIEIFQRAFVYLPYMHSESLTIHQLAVKLFDRPGMEDNFKFELLHKEIIEKFGRFPHRNRLLGRISTPTEIEFLKTHSGF